MIKANSPTKESHGMAYSKEYNAWAQMLSRCSNPKVYAYRWYGAKGIKVCQRWKKFSNFFADMGERPTPKHSIDRIDGNSDYTPENCRWATQLEQQNNRSSSRKVDWKGKRIALIELSRLENVSYELIWDRLRRGWEVEKAVYQPSQKCHLQATGGI